MAEFSIAQIAARLGVSERTARRWIEAGRLDTSPAHRRGHYHVDLDQLEQLARNEPDELTALRSEVAALSRRVEELERLVRESPTRRPAPAGQPAIPELEPDLVGAEAFATQHSINPGTAKSAYQSGRIPTRRGKWRVAGQRNPLTVALDQQGRARFWQLYHDHASFQACPDCPHDQDTGQRPQV